MSIEELKRRVPDICKDVRLNLTSLASDETFGPDTKYGLMLACAIATRNGEVAKAFDAEVSGGIAPAYRDAACAAAAIMAMNNVYYRFVHLTTNKTYATLPARLRMNLIGNPGVPKIDFELWCLAVSAINGCGMCMDAHEKTLTDAGVDTARIQAAVRYAAIIQSVAVAIEVAGLA